MLLVPRFLSARRYGGCMNEAVRILSQTYSSDALLVNLGPPLPDPELASMLNNNVVEVSDCMRHGMVWDEMMLSNNVLDEMSECVPYRVECSE